MGIFCLVVCRVPCPGICFVVRWEEGFFYTPRAAVRLVVEQVGSFSYTSLLEFVLSFFGRVLCLTRPVLVGVSSEVGGEFLLHAP